MQGFLFEPFLFALPRLFSSICTPAKIVFVRMYAHYCILTGFYGFWQMSLVFYVIRRTKWRSYGIPYVLSPFVCLSGVFLMNRSYKLSDFLHEVRVSSDLKNDGDWVFEKKILFWGFWAKRAENGSKMRFSSFLKNQCVFFLSVFLHKLQGNKFFKLTDLNDFRRKILFGGYRVKRGQSWPKLRFFKFYEKLTLIKLAYKLKNWP